MTEAHKEICKVYSVNCLTERTCEILFKSFRFGDFPLKDDQRSGRPSEVDDYIKKVIIESNRHINVRETSKQLNVSHTFENHLERLKSFWAC